MSGGPKILPTRDWYRHDPRGQHTVRASRAIRADMAPMTGDRNIVISAGEVSLPVWLTPEQWRELVSQAGGPR